MGIHRKVAALAVVLAVCAAAGATWSEAQKNESTYVWSVRDEAALRSVFTELGDDVDALEPEHSLVLVPVADWQFDAEYTFDIDGPGGYPAMTASGLATGMETDDGFTLVTGALSGEAEIGGGDCSIKVSVEFDQDSARLCGGIAVTPKLSGEPAVVVLGEPTSPELADRA